MQRIIMLLALLPVFAYASYNPFFTPHKKRIAKPKIVKQVITQRKAEKINIQFTYFAYMESKKGKFALIKFNGKNMVIRQNDSIYLGDNRYKVQAITSNYLRISDYKETKTVYFSTSNGGK